MKSFVGLTLYVIATLQELHAPLNRLRVTPTDFCEVAGYSTPLRGIVFPRLTHNNVGKDWL